MVEQEIFFLFLLFQIFWLYIPIKMKADTEQAPDEMSEMEMVYPRKKN